MNITDLAEIILALGWGGGGGRCEEWGPTSSALFLSSGKKHY